MCFCFCFFALRVRFTFFLFFSSRRRHTISLRDWSSDVCSSDLGHAGDDRSSRALHFCFQHRLHGRGQEFHQVLCVPFVLLRCDARAGYRQQSASAFHFLGACGARVVFAHWILDPKAERGGGCKKGVHHHAHRRHGTLPRNAVALWPERHASL